MVKNTGEAPGAGPIRSLNLPALVRVEEDKAGRPVAFTLRRRKLRVSAIEDMWEIAEEWWRASPVARAYYRVILEDGRSVVVFHDLVNGAWYQQRG